MEKNKTDVIIGIHSIRAALQNKKREWFKLWVTEQSWKEIKAQIPEGSEGNRLTIERFPNDALFQASAQKLYQNSGWQYHRVPSSILLESSPLPFYSVQDLWGDLEKKSPLKILALDRVSDVHNGAAIMRTAAFYGVDYFVIGAKGNFGLTPSFYRMASGGVEHLKVMVSSNLSRLITQLQEKGCDCLGFCEGGESGDLSQLGLKEKHRCLVMGSEEEGISNAVERALKYKVALIPRGPLSTLNVSVATAIAMERFF